MTGKLNCCSCCCCFCGREMAKTKSAKVSRCQTDFWLFAFAFDICQDAPPNCLPLERKTKKPGSRHFGLLTAFGQNVYSSIADILARHTTKHVTYAGSGVAIDEASWSVSLRQWVRDTKKEERRKLGSPREMGSGN